MIASPVGSLLKFFSFFLPPFFFFLSFFSFFFSMEFGSPVRNRKDAAFRRWRFSFHFNRGVMKRGCDTSASPRAGERTSDFCSVLFFFVIFPANIDHYWIIASQFGEQFSHLPSEFCF